MVIETSLYHMSLCNVKYTDIRDILINSTVLGMLCRFSKLNVFLKDKPSDFYMIIIKHIKPTSMLF